MKSIKIMFLSLLSVTLVAGCTRSDRPRIADGTALAIGWRSPTDGKLKKFVDDLFAKRLRSGESGRFFGILKKAGFDNLDVNWGLLTTAQPVAEDGKFEKFPDIALVVSRSHDVKKIVAAICEEARGGIASEDVKIAGRSVIRLVKKGEDVSKVNLTPHFASLQGKLLIVTSNAECMERQLGLYLDGKGVSADFRDFTIGKDDMLRLAVPELGKMIALQVDKKTIASYADEIPDGDAIATGLGAVQLQVRAPHGNSLDVRLIADAANAEHAQTLLTAINGKVLQGRAKLQRLAKCDDRVGVVGEILKKFSARAEGERVVLSLPITEEHVSEVLENVSKELKLR